MDVALFYASPERNRKRRDPEVSNYIFSEHWDSGKPRRPAREVKGTRVDGVRTEQAQLERRFRTGTLGRRK